MCGFVVTTRLDDIELMTMKQKMRGPDNTGYWKDNTLAFGHNLLDVNGEHQLQPFKTKKGNILVFNGEMYDSNIANDTAFLGNGMDMFGFNFISNTDWHGSFAYYNPEKQILIVARDHFGAKPLWIYKKGKNLTVTTSLKSIYFKEANPKEYNKYMNNPLWLGTTSPYKDIVKVAPGGYFRFNLKTGEISRRNLWRNFRIRSEPLNIDEFKDFLLTSVRKVAKNKQKTAIFLSGGLDSTSALGMLKDQDLDLTAYICDYTKGGHTYHDHDAFRNEAKMAVQTCKEWNVPFKLVKLQKEYVNHYDRMWLNGTHFPWVDKNRRAPRFALCKAASQDGCKVVLTGDSADELFTGYIHHDKYYDDEYNKETIDVFASRMSWIPTQIFSKTDWKNNSLWFDLVSTSEQNILATDQTTGIWGMESRPVFLTQSFARYMFQMNGEIKFKKHPDYKIGTYKYLLREVMKEYLPKHVRNRKKKVGWSSPWDNNHPDLQKLWKMQDLEYTSQL